MEVPLLAVAPVTLVCATVHAKVVPLTGDESAMEVAAPLHIVCDEGVATTVGAGFTVTVSLKGAPAQPLAVAVITYIAVPATLPVAVNVCAIDAPLFAVAPDTPV
jgi:hypothetical protein